MATEKQLISVADCPCDGCKAKPCGHPARCVKFALWLKKTVDAVPVVHGRWEDIYGGKYDNYRFRCSVCKEKSLFKEKRNTLGNWITVQALTDYCPNCGAKMDGRAWL